MNSLCFYSPKSCITCVKWLSSLHMHNFYSSFCQNLQSTCSPCLCWRVCVGSPSLHSTYLFQKKYMILFVYLCSKNVTVRFARRTDIMPPAPLETKYHPSAVDLLLIKRLIAETSKQNLLQFLQHEFVNVGKSHAERLIGKTRN